MLDAELLFRLRFAAHFRYFFDHRFLFSSWRKRLRVIIDHDLVAIVGNKRVERFDQMPRRAVHHRLERGVNVFCGPRPHFSPLDTSSSSITPFEPRFTVTTPSKS